MGSIIQDGIIMMVMLFVIIAMYIFVSSPFDTVYNSFENINQTVSDSHIEAGTSMGRTIFNMMFGVAGIIPIAWFVIRVFRREPDWGFK